MVIMKCTGCDKELKADMEIEYSQWLTSYFCHPNCATDYYFNEMQSTPFEVEFEAENNPEELEERGIKIVDGKLYSIEQ